MKHEARSCVRGPVVRRIGGGGNIKLYEWSCPECGARSSMAGAGITCDGSTHMHRGPYQKTRLRRLLARFL